MRNTILQQKTPGFRLFPIRCANHGFRNATTLRCVTLGAGGSQNDAEIMDFRVTSHDPPQATVARWPAKRQSLNRFSVPLSPRPQINALEGLGPPSQLKAPIQNKYPPLKGLWHKHYQLNGLRSLAMNIGNALKRYGLPYAQQKVNEAKAAGELRYFSAEDVKPIVNDALHNNFVQLGKDGAVSGEWLVFAKHEGNNYYLCLTTHDTSQHAQVRQTIDAMCCREFPCLPALLASA